MKNNINIDKIALLSGLLIDDSEKEDLEKEVNKLIDFSAAIAENTDECHLSENGFAPESVTRKDVARDGIDRALLLNSAPSVSDDGYVRVPSVMREDGRRENE